jgi:hypothetical protein
MLLVLADHAPPWPEHRCVPFHLDWLRIESARESEIGLAPE